MKNKRDGFGHPVFFDQCVFQNVLLQKSFAFYKMFTKLSTVCVTMKKTLGKEFIYERKI